MAQTSSAQREPSMEEILASIRRIIEDSDTARKEPDDFAARFSGAADNDAVDDDGDHEMGAIDELEIEIEAFQEDIVDEEAGATEAELSQNDPVIDEDADRSASAGLRELDALIHEHPSRELAMERVARVTPFPARESEARTMSSQMMSEPRRDASHAPASSFADADRPVEEIAASNSAPATSSMATSAPTQAPAATGASGDLGSILSEQAGRQVAAAFGELSDAFAANRRRGFDDMAREMLRPMLQDWLDNNLPTLVEKLVREEIERVARGEA